MTRARTKAACERSVLAEMNAPRFRCGRCGGSFESKRAKIKHKAECPAKITAALQGNDRCPDEFAYGRHKATPATKAAAAAEWAAMDWRGNLPVGWVNPVCATGFDCTLVIGD